MDEVARRNVQFKKLFIDCLSHLERPISYNEFAQAGMKDYEYLKYCNLCDAVRGACLIWGNSSTYSEPSNYEVINLALEPLKKYIETLLGETFANNIPPYVFTANNVLFYYRDCIGANRNSTISYVYTSPQDFRRWIEVFIRKYILLCSTPKKVSNNDRKSDSNKPSKKEKRESCEFFNAHLCILDHNECDSDYCSNYLIASGLPIKRIPTNKYTVDFEDTVTFECIDSDRSLITLSIPCFHDQDDLKPIEKAAIHRVIGDIIHAGMTNYRIVSIVKSKTDSNRPQRKTCLMSEHQKAEKQIDEFQKRLDDLKAPIYPTDFEDSMSVTNWAKEMAKYIKDSENLEYDIEDYEEWMSE